MTLKMAMLLILNVLHGTSHVSSWPRRIAEHPGLSGLLPLSACKGMSSELGQVCLDNLRGRDAYEEKRKAYDEKRDAYDEKRKIDRKDYQIFLGYYRDNDYIVTGKRSTRLCQRGFAKHESYIYLGNDILVGNKSVTIPI